MSDKKLKIISMSLPPAVHDLMKDAATKLGYRQGSRSNVSRLVRELVEKHLDQMLRNHTGDEAPAVPANDDVVKVMLEIPVELRQNPDKLKQWLSVKTEAIARALA